MMLVSCTRSPPNWVAMLPQALIVETTASLAPAAVPLPALDGDVGAVVLHAVPPAMTAAHTAATTHARRRCLVLTSIS